VYTLDSLEGKVDGDTIAGFHVGNDADADILDIRDLIDGLGKAGSSLEEMMHEGYISLKVHDGGDGKVTMVLGVDRDGKGDEYGQQTLCTIHMSGITFSQGPGSDSLEQQLLTQLMEHSQIKF
jgi:hypothetical protein